MRAALVAWMGRDAAHPLDSAGLRGRLPRGLRLGGAHAAPWRGALRFSRRSSAAVQSSTRVPPTATERYRGCAPAVAAERSSGDARCSTGRVPGPRRRRGPPRCRARAGRRLRLDSRSRVQDECATVRVDRHQLAARRSTSCPNGEPVGAQQDFAQHRAELRAILGRREVVRTSSGSTTALPSRRSRGSPGRSSGVARPLGAREREVAAPGSVPWPPAVTGRSSTRRRRSPTSSGPRQLAAPIGKVSRVVRRIVQASRVMGALLGDRLDAIQGQHEKATWRRSVKSRTTSATCETVLACPDAALALRTSARRL